TKARTRSRGRAFSYSFPTPGDAGERRSRQALSRGARIAVFGRVQRVIRGDSRQPLAWLDTQLAQQVDLTQQVALAGAELGIGRVIGSLRLTQVPVDAVQILDEAGELVVEQPGATGDL